MKPNNWVSSSQAAELLVKQVAIWPLAERNYRALQSVRTKAFDMGGFTLRCQFNPARMLSTGAKVDSHSLQARQCFLCPDSLPVEQERLPFGLRYLVLCNPYPIFPEHFTVPSREHSPQLIQPRIDDFLELTQRMDRYTVFYNGPRSGASAPDHAHFQVVTRGIMPMDTEVLSLLAHNKLQQLPTEGYEGNIYLLNGYLRNGFVLQARTHAAAAALFQHIYEALPMLEGEAEPRMNLFGMYHDHQWILTLIPRRAHRPWQYEAEGDEHLLSSPGAADIGGLFITPLEKDFDKITPALLTDVYQQVCFSGQEVADIFVHLSTQLNIRPS